MTIHHKTTGLASIAALALGAIVAFSGQDAGAATVSSSGVFGGCAGGIVPLQTNDAGFITNAAGINVLQGGSWDATFTNGDPGGTCAFTLVNPSSSARAATMSVATVNQNGLQGTPNSWGFAGGAVLTSPQLASGDPFELWRLDEGEGGFRTFSFNIAPNSAVFFDWTWGTAYTSSDFGNPNIDFVVAATPVPLPAAGLMLLGGLGGLAALRRRKRAV